MPQPLKKTDDIAFRPNGVLERPKLAAHLANIASLSAHVDLSLAMVLAGFMGTEQDVAVAIFNAIESEGPKTAVLRAMANKYLNEGGVKEFNGLLQKIRERRIERNNVIHGLWAISPHYPQELIWMDPRDFTTYISDVGVNFMKQQPRPAPPWDRALVYSEQDFINIGERLQQLEALLLAFFQALATHAK